jgi:hypothetical protein
MMNTSAAKLDRFAIHQEALFGVPLELTDTNPFPCFVNDGKYHFRNTI